MSGADTRTQRAEDTEAETGWCPGGRGGLLEKFTVGDMYYNPFGKTVTDSDNQWFAVWTQNAAKTRVDANFTTGTEFGKPLVIFLYPRTRPRQSTIDLSNVCAALGRDLVRMPHPVYEGDTIHFRSKMLNIRGSGSRPIPVWSA